MKTLPSLLLLSLAACSLPATAAEATTPDKRPNILLILADDVGFSDLGCYGGEIQTPNLDKLAADGLRCTQFYNGARCCPSRASLLTGQYPHAVGFPGMSGSLPKNCATIPEILRTANYRTLMVGKWHLGDPGPIVRGFDEYYGMFGGYGSFWNPNLYTRRPADRTPRKFEEGKFYSTDAFTDYALDFLDGARQDKKPWFLYMAFNAAHFPLHAPQAEIAKYAKTYAAGWDKIRAARFAKQKELGVLGTGWPLTPRSIIPPNPVATPHSWADKENPAWESLSEDRRADLARRMAVYAAMIDRMDQNIGRVISDLKKNSELDNTLIFFLSDNGACAEWDPFGFDVLKNNSEVNLGTTSGDNTLHTGAELDAIGAPGSYVSYGSGWANASNTPFRLYKHYSHEGGIATPLIVHWPAGMKRHNELDHQPGHLIDILPTCIEVSGAKYPGEVLPLVGRSLIPTLHKTSEPSRPIFFEHEGSRAVRNGRWKLVGLANKPWELYDMEADRVELNDLASKEPTRVAELVALYDEWAQRMHIVKKQDAQPAKPTEPTTKTGEVKSGDIITYKTIGERELKLFIEKPAEWKATDQRPAAVFFFGGGWVGGTPNQFLKQSEYLASRGIVGVRVEYRVIPKGDKGPPVVCCADAKSAIRYVRSHAAELGVDPRRIAGVGGSAGGHLAAFTALVEGLDDAKDDVSVSCKPNALVLFNPVFNNGPGQWGHERVGDRLLEFSPAHHVTKDAPPTIVFLGDADNLIPVQVLKDFEAEMKKVNVRCDAPIFPNAGHGFFNRDPHFTLTLIEADKFLASLGWLTGPPTLQPPVK